MASHGIMAIWNKQVELVTSAVKSRSILHVVIPPIHSRAWILSVLYNPSSIQGQSLTWKELSGITILNILWIILGEFNAVVDHYEHRGGSHSNYIRKAGMLSNFISKNSLLDVGFVRSEFTSWNN